MANGYIGKISAVVTANTSDLSRKLQGAVKDVDRFANTLNRSVSASAQRATASLENIFTPLQRLERKLQTALRLNLRTAGEVREIQALTQVAEQLNRPLEGLQKRFTGLSLDIQSRFAPALRQAQDQVVAFNDLTSRTGAIAVREFRSTEDAVNRTAQALARLSQAQQLANQGFTGRELQFSSPRAFEVLQSSASTTQRAGQLPADRLADGDIARQVQRLQQFRNAVAQTIAEVEEIRLRPNVDATALAAAERRLASIVETTRRAQRQLDDTIDAPTRAAAAAQRAADNEIALLQRREQAAKQAQDRQNALAQRAADNEIALLQRREQAAKQLQDQQNAAAQRAADNEIALLQRREQAAKQLEDERAARLARANELLTIDTAESDRLSRESGLERSAGASTRLIDRVGPSVTALRGQLDGLAEPLRASIGPEVDRLQTKFQLLARAGVAQSAEEVQRLKGEIAGLNAALDSRRGIGQNFLQSFGGAGAAGLSLGVDERSLRAIGSQIEFVQTRLSGLGQEARGPVLQALEALRVRANALFQGGALDTRQGRQELELLRQELIRTLSAAGAGTESQVASSLKRAGDIGRFGIDKLQLGLQQAVFAVDDFFSVTGDLQQRIRAIGNNITQLGFIIGGTTGLFVGLAAVLVGQGFAAFQRFTNKGVEAKDRLKQLGEAAKQQEQIVKDLADAFNELSDDLAQRGLTEATRRAEQLSKRLDDIVKKQQELQRQRLADVDPAVQEARGQQAALRQRLDAADTPGQRIAIQALLDEQRRREQDAVSRVLGNARNLDIGESVRRATDLIFREQLAGIVDAGGVQSQRGVPFLERLPESAQFRIDTARARAASAFGGIDINDRDAVRAAAVDQRNRLAPIASQRTALGFRTNAAVEAEAALANIEQLIRSLDAVGQQADLDRFSQGVAKAASSVDEFLPKAIARLQDTAEVIRAPSLALIAQIESLTNGLRQQADAVAAANVAGDVGAAKAAEARANEIADQIKARESEIAAIESTAASVKQFSAVLDRVSTELANAVAQEARSAADQARRDANREQGILEAGLGGRQGDADAAGQRRVRLEDQAAEFARRAAAIEAANTRAMVDFVRQAQAGALGPQAQALIRRRDEAQAVIDNRQSPADAVTEAQATLKVITTQLQQIFEQSGAGEAAAKLADELNKAAAAAARREELIARGRELDLTPAQQAGRDLAEDIRAIRERLAVDVRAAPQGRAALAADAEADIARVREDAFRQQAPAIFGLADAVQNAILQGPSRAALEATDVSTVEGARELNRLLRGEDAARNQDLVQLQREANRLLQLIAEGGADIAN